MKIDKNSPYYILAILIFLIGKLVFREADVNALFFLLTPINFLIELSTGSVATLTENSEYFHSFLNIIIDKSCSGYNFMLLSFVMFSCTAFKYLPNTTMKLAVVPLSLFTAWILTIFVNTSRILISVFTQNTLLLPHDAVHQSIGIFVYLTTLIISYQILQYLLQRQNWNHAKFT